MGYVISLNCVNMLVQFIINLGYEVIVFLNDIVLSILMVIEVGLGEYGCYGLFIILEFGFNVCIVKVFIDLFFEVD